MSNADAEVERALQRMIDAEVALEQNRRSNGDWAAWQRAATDYWLLLHPDDARFRRGDPAATPTIDQMRGFAERISLATKGVPSTWRLDPRSPERDLYLARVGWWHELGAALYEPIRHSIQRVSRGDSPGVETLVRFLEADVYCHRSGYMKADVIRFLTRTELDVAIEDRLREVVLAAVDGRDRREFKAYIRLARRVDSERLRQDLTSRAGSSMPRSARHAQWMLAGLDTKPYRSQ